VVDRHGADVQLLEVEVEARQRLRRDGADLVDGVEAIRRRVVGEGQVVVADVEAAVALEREVGIAEPASPTGAGAASARGPLGPPSGAGPKPRPAAAGLSSPGAVPTPVLAPATAGAIATTSSVPAGAASPR
jgi:hypothetical protein